MSLMDYGFSRKGKAASTTEEEGSNDCQSSSHDQSQAGPITKRSKQSYEATKAFKESWKKDFPWVQYDAATNILCPGEFPTHADEMSFSQEHFRIQNLRAHGTSKAHDNCKMLKQPKIIQLWLP
jgi:hypothetical protein